MALKKNAKIKGVTVEINGDATGLGKAISEAQHDLTVFRNELNQINSMAQIPGANYQELVAKKQEALNKAIAEARKQYEGLTQAVKETEQAMANGNPNEITASQFSRLQQEALRAERQLRQLEGELPAVRAGFLSQADAARAAAEAQEKLQAATARLHQSFGAFKANLASCAADIGKVVTALGAVTAAAAGASVKVGMAFETSMSKVQALSGASEAEFKQLSDAAKEMGATTSKTAAQSADALGYMALAGWKTEQMLGGLEPILRASEAGAMDLATCSDLVTDSMSAMGVQVDDLGHYLDIVAKAQSSSNTNMQQLLEAYIEVGGTLRNLNVSLEESATLLGTLANRGKKGSEAGHDLNSILVNLIGANRSAASAMDELGVSAWDSKGNFIGLTETVRLLSEKLNEIGIESEQAQNFIAKIGGKTQMGTLQALISGVNEEYGQLFEALSNCDGAAEDTAKTMQKNLGGAMTAFGSAMEGLGIEVFEEFQEPLTEAVNIATEEISKLNSEMADGELGESVAKIAGVIGEAIKDLAEWAADEGIPKLIGFLGKLADNADGTAAAVKGLAAGLIGLKPAKTIIAGFITLMDLYARKQAKAAAQTAATAAAQAAQTAATTAQATATGAATVAQNGLNAAMKANLFGVIASLVIGAVTAIVKYTESIESVSDKLDKINEKTAETKEQIESTYEAAGHSEDRFKQLAKTYETLRKRYNETGEGAERLKEVVEELNGLSPATLDLLDEETGKYRELAGEVDNVVAAMKRKRDVDKAKSTWDAEMDNLDEKKKLFADAQKEYMDYMTEVQGDGVAGYGAWSSYDEKKAEELKESEKNALAAVREQEKVVADIEARMNALYTEQDEAEREASRKTSADYAAEYVEQMKNQNAKTFEEYSRWQADRFAEFEEQYNQLKEAYEVGDIEDENAYRQELHALLAEYGDRSLEEYQDYYKELHKLDNNFRKDQEKQAEADAKEQQKILEKQLDDEEKAREKSLDNAKQYYADEAKAARQSAEEMADSYTEGLEKILDDRQAMLDKISDFDFFGEDKKGNKVLTDLDAEKKKLDEYAKGIEELRKKGVSEEIIGKIKDMSFDDGSMLIKNLNSMKSKSLQLWLKDYEELTAAQEEFVNDEYASEVDSFQKNFASQIEEIAIEMSDAGKNGGLNFAAAFLDGVNRGMGGDLNNLLNAYSKATPTAQAEMKNNQLANALTSGAASANISGGDVVFTIDGNVIGRAAIDYINGKAAQGGDTIKF